MKINNLIDCSRPKPRRHTTFSGSENSCGEKKTRYKHYEQMNDEVLGFTSVIKAHNEVKNSGKMRFFKVIPGITTALLGTSIALAQPGKLSAKTISGLGFLALYKGLDIVADFSANHADKKQKEEGGNLNDKFSDTLKTYLLGSAALIAGMAAIFGAIKNVKALEGVKKFITKELTQLSGEIDNSKAGNFFENTIRPFANKHPDATSALKIISPFAVLASSVFAQSKLSQSLSNDLKNKAADNFSRGKEIQRIAREDFDSIDAIEV